MASPVPLEMTTPVDPPTSLEQLFRLWGLNGLLRRYHSRILGIEHLYPWQARCLALPGVAAGEQDLLYFAPTSGGKTLVAELLVLLRVMGLPVACPGEEGEGVGRGVSAAANPTPSDGVDPLESGMATGVAQPHEGQMTRTRRAIIVLPFVSMVTEKAKHLRGVVAPYNRGRPKKQRIQVRALHGIKGGDLKRTHIAVCTIEKANGLINRMAAAEELHELSCLVVDELHMIGESGRGQTLELLLTKARRAQKYLRVLKQTRGVTAQSRYRNMLENRLPEAQQRVGLTESFSCKRVLRNHVLRANRAAAERAPALQEGSFFGLGRRPSLMARHHTQIVGMSATLSNGAEVAKWLGAALHVSDYRPIPLDERVLLGMHVYDSAGNIVRAFAAPANPQTDPDHVVTLCRESCREGDQVIIFCPTKQFCNNCALKVAKNLKLPTSKAVESKRATLVAQLAKEMSMSVDPLLQETIPHGVAFHHAGLADNERSAIEQAFRSGTLGVLAATSTLGAGVNLPAGRVILRNINAVGGGLNATSYRQMAGRAGRKGVGRARGEALIVAANKGEAKRAAGLMNSGLAAMTSALHPTADGGTGFTRMVLEAVCGKLVLTRADLSTLLDCTLVYQQQNDDRGREELHDYAWAALQFLIEERCVELVRPPPQLKDKRVRGVSVATATAKSAPGGGSIPCEGTAATAVQTQTPPAARPLSAVKRQKGCVVQQQQQQPQQLGALTMLNGISDEAVPSQVFCEGRGGGFQEPGGAGRVCDSVGSCGKGRDGDDIAEVDRGILVPTKLGMAIFRSSMSPGDGLVVYKDLSGAKNGINLRHTLYLAYLLTPLCPPSGLKPNWERLRAMYAKAQAAAAETPPGPKSHLVEDFRKIGVTENQLHLWASRGSIGGAREVPLLSAMALREAARARRGSIDGAGVATAGNSCRNEQKEPASTNAAKKAVRLVAAMALQDVADGYHLGQVARSYGMNKGELQSLRQSTATFAGMVASFLKELGWTMFLMLVKGYIPKLSLGVSNQLLPLMQVPGMSRNEAKALFQEGIVNAKSLLSASSVRVSTALRINVPFRKAVDRSSGSGRQETNPSERFRYDRRAQILKDSARAVDTKREKSNKAQAMKLLKAVQGRLGNSDADAFGSALLQLGSGDGLVAPKSRKRKRSLDDRCETPTARSRHGGGISNLGETGLSEDDIGSVSDGSNSSYSFSDDDDDDLSENSDVDDIDAAVAVFLSRAREEDIDDVDSDDVDLGDGEGNLRERPPQDMGDDDRNGRGGGGEKGKVEISHQEEQQRSKAPEGQRLLAAAPAPRHKQQRQHTVPPGGTRDSAVGISRLVQEHPQGLAISKDAAQEKGTAGEGRVMTMGATATRSVLSSGGGSEGFRSERQGGIATDQSPAEIFAGSLMAPGTGNRDKNKPIPTDSHRPFMTPVIQLSPESGSSSFLYEAGTSICQAILGTQDDEVGVVCSSHAGEGEGERGKGVGGASFRDPAETGVGTAASATDEPEGLRIGPAFAACRADSRTPSRSTSLAGERDTPAGVHDGRGTRKDVFSEGAAAMAEFSSTWRRSRCFSFVIGSRDLHWLEDGRGGAASRGGVGAVGGWGGDGWVRGYRRSWEPLAASWALPVAPYTVRSGGEGGIPLSQRGKGESMRVVSGIAVSFDGRTSCYLSLPPTLPNRPENWQKPSSVIRNGAPPIERGGASFELEGRQRSTTSRASVCWEGLPEAALEQVALSVGFPWLCIDCNTTDQNKRCRRHSLEGDGNIGAVGGASGSDSGGKKQRRRRLRPWNQSLLVCRRWNALGVKALNWLTAEEPSCRWGLVRDVMEDKETTKVCLDMKGALICLRSLGLSVKGPLEDPAVARWLAEPPIEDISPLQQQKQKQASSKRKTPQPPPRAPPASLSLDRSPVDVVDLWCLQAEATLSFMAEKEQALRDLSLTLPFFLLEMPAVAAAASMEYSGLALDAGTIVGARRDLELRLDDLEGLAEQLVGDYEETDEKTVLASPKRVHDMLYATLGVSPPPSWVSGRGGGGRGASKKASLGPTDTNSLQELLKVSAIAAGGDGRGDGAKAGGARRDAGTSDAGCGSGASETAGVLTEEARGFIRAVIQHRYLAPAKRSLVGLLASRRRHPYYGGVRVNPRINMFTTTGRMVASDPPLQNLDHKIRLTRSWRTSLAEEMEAEVDGLENIPRVWAGAGVSAEPSAEVGGPKPSPQLLNQELGEDVREALRVSVAPRGDSASMNTGHIVGIVEDRSLNDPIYKQLSPPEGVVGGAVSCREDMSALTARSMVSLWRESGHSYSLLEAERTRQVLVRLGGRHGKVYSYPADKVYRVRANFFSDSQAEAMAGGGLGTRCPWFTKEALLRPRDTLVASPGYTFVSADYSQVEMRLMAHLSGDPDLLRVFSDGGDVFRRIAAALEGRGKKAADVTEEERRQVVVYGVLYGQSTDTLAPQLGLSRLEAFKIRRAVLETYPKLTEYLRRVTEDCRKCGYVETLLGRRRYLPQINSPDNTERSRAERQAANTKTQGSAADLLKLAATNVAARLERCEWMSRPGSSHPSNDPPPGAMSPCRFPVDGGRAELARRPACRLVLSIHDELLYEVLQPYATEVAHIVKACMEGACSLSVPLVADPRWGTKWGSMTPVEDTKGTKRARPDAVVAAPSTGQP